MAQELFRGAGNSLYLDLGGGYMVYAHVKMFLVVYLRFMHFTNVSYTSI